MQKSAIISVSDRRGIIEFAQELQGYGYRILSSSGTAKFLAQAGIVVSAIEQYVGSAELLGGRVKTLHPKIHAGILARRDNQDDLEQLSAADIVPIDLVVVNLYPFEEKLRSEEVLQVGQMIEFIDIGGPAMLRAAAKNFAHVLPVISPDDYSLVLDYLRGAEISDLPFEFRQNMAAKVFAQIARYDLEISKYLSVTSSCAGREKVYQEEGQSIRGRAPDLLDQIWTKQQELRYGENPHQQGAFYADLSSISLPWQQLNGKELSYNNILDLDAVIRILQTLQTDLFATVIVKHNNPCGVALADNLVESLRHAKQSDPLSHFGGIIGFRGEVDRATAEEVVRDFSEVVVANFFSADALAVLKQKRNLRVLQIGKDLLADREVRTVVGGLLWQESDKALSSIQTANPEVGLALTAEAMRDLQFAWGICRHCKSNAVLLVAGGMVIGAGLGQTSRVDAVELAVLKACKHGHQLSGSVAASDGFFPFADSLEILAKHGVAAVVAPRGSMRDEEVIAAAKKLGITLFFASRRHFRH